MTEHILFLTGKLAEKSLNRVLSAMQPTEFSWEVRHMRISVAALLTTDMVARRLSDTEGVDRIILPGRCRGDTESLSKTLGIPVERGPDELKDLPIWFGGEAIVPDLSQYDINIFAEIVDASERSIDSIIERAHYYRDNGANIIDLGLLPNTPFPHLEDAINALKSENFKVSVDTLDPKALLRATGAGADFMLSLNEKNLWVADETDAVPILIPTRNDQPETLFRTIDTLLEKSRPFIADPILDPIHSGFADSIVRYHETRRRYPDIEIMMGVGNLTELTHADTAGTNMLLLGLMSELDIRHMLATEVSRHCRNAIKEADRSRRILYHARTEGTPPRLIDESLMALHERNPFPYSATEIQEFSADIKDPNYRIQLSDEGVHVYNRDGIHCATDPFEHYPQLSMRDDCGHAFYLGVELARAQVAWQLGKTYNQDEELYWGCAVEKPDDDKLEQREAGTTMKNQKKT